MRKYSCFFGAIIIAFAAKICVGEIVTTFDSGLEGWTIVSNGSDTSTFVSTGGNPGGFLQSTDAVSGPMSAKAPTAFTGDISFYDQGLFSFDARIVNPAGSSVAAAGNVTIFATSGNATLDFAPSGYSTDWSGYSMRLDASDWGVSQPQWDGILTSVTAIHIVLDSTLGFDTVGLDNVAITSVPEPTTIAMFGIAMLGIARRRRMP